MTNSADDKRSRERRLIEGGGGTKRGDSSSAGGRSADAFRIEEPVGGHRFDFRSATSATEESSDITLLDEETAITVEISEQHLEGQKEALMHETGASEAVADAMFEVFRRIVEEEAEAQGKDWSKEAVEAVTNAMVATAIQEEKQRSLLA
jgi:glutamine synthetase type III